MTDEWYPINQRVLIHNWYYDFKMKNGSIIFGGFVSKGTKYANKYGIKIEKPTHFREHKFYKLKV